MCMPEAIKEGSAVGRTPSMHHRGVRFKDLLYALRMDAVGLRGDEVMYLNLKICLLVSVIMIRSCVER